MAFINITPCENTTVYNTYVLPVLVYSSEMWDMAVTEVQRATRRFRSVVPSTHSTSPIYCSCHQPRSPPPLCSAPCHPDSHAQASEVIRNRSHRPLGLRWGPYTCPQRWHRWPAEGVETTSSNMAAYRREDLKQQNLGLWSAQNRAYDHEQWREIVETAMLLQGHATWWWGGGGSRPTSGLRAAVPSGVQGLNLNGGWRLSPRSRKAFKIQ